MFHLKEGKYQMENNAVVLSQLQNSPGYLPTKGQDCQLFIIKLNAFDNF